MAIMRAMKSGLKTIWMRVFGFFGSSSKTHAMTNSTISETERIDYWAYHHCERENAKWLGTDPMNLCPLKGTCPGCQEKAREAITKSS